MISPHTTPATGGKWGTYLKWKWKWGRLGLGRLSTLLDPASCRDVLLQADTRQPTYSAPPQHTAQRTTEKHEHDRGRADDRWVHGDIPIHAKHHTTTQGGSGGLTKQPRPAASRSPSVNELTRQQARSIRAGLSWFWIIGCPSAQCCRSDRKCACARTRRARYGPAYQQGHTPGCMC
eukprot:scaffold11336_cov133-Isochrysis_galbana.AAC.1